MCCTDLWESLDHQEAAEDVWRCLSETQVLLNKLETCLLWGREGLFVQETCGVFYYQKNWDLSTWRRSPRQLPAGYMAFILQMSETCFGTTDMENEEQQTDSCFTWYLSSSAVWLQVKDDSQCLWNRLQTPAISLIHTSVQQTAAFTLNHELQNDNC